MPLTTLPKGQLITSGQAPITSTMSTPSIDASTCVRRWLLKQRVLAHPSFFFDGIALGSIGILFCLKSRSYLRQHGYSFIIAHIECKSLVHWFAFESIT
jgi:hypothetical protein